MRESRKMGQCCLTYITLLLYEITYTMYSVGGAADTLASAVDTLQEEDSGATNQGAREPGLFPAHHLVPGQDDLPPALELFLQLGSFLSLGKVADM